MVPGASAARSRIFSSWRTVLVFESSSVLQQRLNCLDHLRCADEAIELEVLGDLEVVWPWLTSVEAVQLASSAAV